MKYLLRVDLGLSTVALAGGRQGQVERLPADPHLSLKADPDFGEGTFRFAAPPPSSCPSVICCIFWATDLCFGVNLVFMAKYSLNKASKYSQNSWEFPSPFSKWRSPCWVPIVQIVKHSYRKDCQGLWSVQTGWHIHLFHNHEDVTGAWWGNVGTLRHKMIVAFLFVPASSTYCGAW